MNDIQIGGDFDYFIKIFLEENSKVNLISKNDEKFLYSKHIYDSLAINLFFKKYSICANTIVDVGCGGGFPCVPIAIEYPDINIIGIDSIKKKINAVENIKNKLKITNLNLICDRVENLNNIKCDIAVSRAVADIQKLVQLAFPLLNKDSYLIAYKSKKADDEIKEAKSILKALKAEVFDIIEYNLPTEEKHERKLVCIRKY